MKRLISTSLMLATLFIHQDALALPDDTSKPLQIQSDKAFFDQKTGEATYEGNVLVTQGSIEIEADYLKVTTNPETRKFSKLVAKGNPAKFSQQIDWTGNILISQGDNIHYSTIEAKLEIKGHGYLNRMEDKISADYILYMINQGTFNAQKQDNGRVFMTLQPQENTQGK